MQELLKRAAQEYGIELDDEMLKRMEDYWRYLIEINEQMNLTAVVSDEEAAQRHFVDSLAPIKAGLVPVGAKAIDVGSGAGFPGMPLKIARPDVRLTLLDSLTKRVNFLTDAAARIGVEVTAVHARAEEAARGELRENFDVVTARAVARLNTLCELTLPFARVGGVLIAYKGPAAQEELEEAQTAIKRLGGGEAKIIDAGVPGRDGKLVVVRKISPTPKAYPRKPGEAGRRPL